MILTKIYKKIIKNWLKLQKNMTPHLISEKGSQRWKQKILLALEVWSLLSISWFWILSIQPQKNIQIPIWKIINKQKDLILFRQIQIKLTKITQTKYKALVSPKN
jgi:hypothetical protein